MQCHEFREIADSYLGNELIVETNHEVISHLEHCSECRRVLAARRELRGQLRRALINAPENKMTLEFADRLSTELHEYARGKRNAPKVSKRGWRSSAMVRRSSWLAVAACLVLTGAFGLVLVRQRLLQRSLQPGGQEVAGHEPTPNYPAQLNPGIPVSIVK